MDARYGGDDVERVLGVDACKGGWVGVRLDGNSTSACFAPEIGELVTTAEHDGPLSVVAIDIPIGLPDQGRRAADVLARAEIGTLRSSVFMMPVRKALAAPDHRTANERSRELTGAGVSIQSFALKPKLLEVDRWIPGARQRVVEVHPEVSFAQLAGAPLTDPKRSWSGAERRKRLLADVGITLGGELGEAGRRAGVDDMLDAVVAAWTARRVARGEAVSRPDPPEMFSDGWPCAIWS